MENAGAGGQRSGEVKTGSQGAGQRKTVKRSGDLDEHTNFGQRCEIIAAFQAALPTPARLRSRRGTPPGRGFC